MSNTFIEEKLIEREWHDRLGSGFWRALHRSALFLEELDRQLADSANSPCKGYTSQSSTIPQGLALISVLDHDDFLFLPPQMSLAAIYRGVTVEQFVGQWLGNLLDPGKGRLPPGNIAAEAFHIMPGIGRAEERIEHALGIALALRLRNHPKIVLLPLFASELREPTVLQALQFAHSHPVPLLFVVMDGAAAELAQAAGIRATDVGAEDILATLKVLKGQVDRIRQKKEAAMVYFSQAHADKIQLSEVVERVLRKKSWMQETDLQGQVQKEIQYGIERARMIPAPPRNTIIQDIRQKMDIAVEEQWREWRKAHGK